MNDMNNLFLQVYVKAQNNLVAAGRSRAAVSRNGRRAAGMLEYVLLGAMAAIIVGLVLRGGVQSIIENLLDRISDFTDGN